jgi:hypothetical protein
VLVDEPSVGLNTTGTTGAVVSTVKEMAVEGGLVLRAASVARAQRVWDIESLREGEGGVRVQSPDALAHARPTEAPSTNTSTLERLSAVPVYVGVGSFVAEPLVGLLTSGRSGGVLSSVKIWGREAELVLPMLSRALAVTEYSPSAKENWKEFPFPLIIGRGGDFEEASRIKAVDSHDDSRKGLRCTGAGGRDVEQAVGRGQDNRD